VAVDNGVTAGFLIIPDVDARNIGFLHESDTSSEALGLNNKSLICGFSASANSSAAFILDQPGCQFCDINTFLTPSMAFTSLTTANGINDNGEFVGEGLVNGVEHGFVGQIVPEPSSLVLLGIGAACLYSLRRRRLALV
jgi:hypothetical protein